MPEPDALQLGSGRLRQRVVAGVRDRLRRLSGSAREVGKTALTAEVGRRASRMGLRVIAGQCDPAQQATPGAAVIAMLRAGREPFSVATITRNSCIRLRNRFSSLIESGITWPPPQQAGRC